MYDSLRWRWAIFRKQKFYEVESWIVLSIWEADRNKWKIHKCTFNSFVLLKTSRKIRFFLRERDCYAEKRSKLETRSFEKSLIFRLTPLYVLRKKFISSFAANLLTLRKNDINISHSLCAPHLSLFQALSIFNFLQAWMSILNMKKDATYFLN